MLLSARSQPNLALRKAKMSWQFTVGLRVKRNVDRIVVDAEDALIAALKVKAERPEATITYVRRLNRHTSPAPQPHGRPLPWLMHDSTMEIARVREKGGLVDLHRQ